jgi:hypothetical protein
MRKLGYDKAAQPVQILPRKVTKVTHPVIAISMTVRYYGLALSSSSLAPLGYSYGMSSGVQGCDLHM